MASGPTVDEYFFIILDRLFQTLDQKINDWFKVAKRNTGKFPFGLGKKKKALNQLMVDRMTVAYDLAAAFFYLHENRYVWKHMCFCNCNYLSVICKNRSQDQAADL